jgi:hypothetical protein
MTHLISTSATTGRVAASVLSVAFAVASTGCGTNNDPSQDPSAETALAFAESLYEDVLTGTPGVCDRFTEAGRTDFVRDMNPAADCEEAVDVLSSAVENYEEFTANHAYTVESVTENKAVIRADFGNYADLMSLEWDDERWLAGPTERVMSTQPQEPVAPEGDHDGHDH